MRTERLVPSSEETPRDPGMKSCDQAEALGRDQETSFLHSSTYWLALPLLSSGPPKSCFWMLVMLIVGIGGDGWVKFPRRAARKKIGQAERGVWRPPELPHAQWVGERQKVETEQVWSGAHLPLVRRRGISMCGNATHFWVGRDRKHINRARSRDDNMAGSSGRGRNGVGT